MKFIIVQVCNELIYLTGAETKKPTGLQQSGLKSKQNVTEQVIFSEPYTYELPKELQEQAFTKVDDFASFVNDSIRSSGMEIAEIILVPDNNTIAFKEYQHAAAKQKFLDSFAVLETETVVSESVSNYSIVNYEYGVPYGQSKTANVDLNAVLFAMHLNLIKDVKEAFAKHHMRITKIIPQGAAIIHSSSYINSVNKAVCVFSIDFTAIRIIVIDNGAVIYSQIFDSPMPEIARLIAEEKNIAFTEALKLVENEGVVRALENNEYSAVTTRSIQGVLDYATGDVLRNLRMVLVSKKIDLTKVYLCDQLALMPRLVKYIRQFGFTMEIEDVGVAFTPENIPYITEKAVSLGYKSSSYFMLANVISLATVNKCNFLSGINSVKSKNSNIGKYASIGLCALAGIFMAYNGAMYGLALWQQDTDKKTLADPKYDEVKLLIQEEANLIDSIANLESDLNQLPSSTDDVSDIVWQTFEQVLNTEKGVPHGNTAQFDNEDNTISLQFSIEDFDTYVKLRDEVQENGYFDVAIAFSYTDRVAIGDEDYATVTVVLAVNQEYVNMLEQEEGGVE